MNRDLNDLTDEQMDKFVDDLNDSQGVVVNCEDTSADFDVPTIFVDKPGRSISVSIPIQLNFDNGRIADREYLRSMIEDQLRYLEKALNRIDLNDGSLDQEWEDCDEQNS